MLDNSNEEKIHIEESKEDCGDGFDNESAGKMARPKRKFKSLASTIVRQHTNERLRIISIASTPSKDRTATEKDSLCDFILSKLQRSIQSFEHLDRSAILGLAASCKLIQVEAGESVYCAGDEVDALYLPISGSVEEHMEGIGRVAAIKPNAGFGFTGVDKSTSCTRQHSVVARDACHLIAVPKHAYQQLVAKIRDEKRKRELAFLLSIPVFSQLARLVANNDASGLTSFRLFDATRLVVHLFIDGGRVFGGRLKEQDVRECSSGANNPSTSQIGSRSLHSFV